MNEVPDNPKILEDRVVNVPIVIVVLFDSVDNANEFYESQQEQNHFQ